jgi:hypothetical protein
MNIVQAKNGVLNMEYKTQEEIKRNHRRQVKDTENLNAQIDVLNHDSYTADTRLLQMQRRILEIEGIVGFPPKKLA